MRPGKVIFYWVLDICITWRGLRICNLVCYQTRITAIANITGESTILLILKYVIKICAVLFGFWTYSLIVYILLRYINAHRRETTPLSSLFPLSQASVLCCTTKYGFNVCVISFDFYSTHYKVYIHVPYIIKQEGTTEPINSTHIISSIEHQTPKLF